MGAEEISLNDNNPDIDAAVPRTPAPRVVRNGDTARIVPPSEAYDIPPKVLADYQKQALDLIDEMRDRILAGEVLGFGIATVTADEGATCISTAWSGGFMGYGIHGLAAVQMLAHRFTDAFYNET